MIVPEKFNEIKPWGPEELPEVYDRLLQNEQFKKVLAFLFPGVPLEAIAGKLKTCKTNLEFQKAFVYDFIKKLMLKASTGFELQDEELDRQGCYTFISNHRDIVMDSGLLDVLLVDNGFATTCEIAIGDNLLSLPWVKDLVRVNKAFIVQRGLPMRQMLAASKLLSDYMHFAIKEKKEHLWIAQREGRSKDSDDRTQEAILKMMTMGGEGSVIDRLLELHIVPTAISYEYDPCDYLKAKEFQQKRDIEGWKKGPNDDVVSMQTGIMGYKGHVHYHCAACIDDFLRSLPADMPKTDIYRVVAEHIDLQIHSNYKLYPSNYIALDELKDTEDYSAYYTAEDKAVFDKYIAGQLAKIDLENKDEEFLRERILTMYANPAINKLKTNK